MANPTKSFGKLTIPLLVLLAISFSALPVYAKYGGGTGEPNDPYRIATAEDLNDIGNHKEDWDKHFVLVNDVNLGAYTGTQFNIIGRYIGPNDPTNKPFTGIFDGNDHKILNFKWRSWGKHKIGLFGYVGRGGQIKNLGMENVNVIAVIGKSVGGLVGWNDKGTITNCYSTGSVGGDKVIGGLVGGNGGTITNSYSTGSVTGEDVGGLVGGNGGTITGCYSKGSVSGEDWVGGLVGTNYRTITNCYSECTVLGSEGSAGGLVGWNYGGIITKCYSTGSVSGSNGVGGLVGVNYNTITNCHSTGTVTGDNSVGGLVGLSSYGGISNCYATGRVRANDVVGGLVGHNGGAISACYSTGGVSGSVHVGGLVGLNNVTITNCYSTGSVLGGAQVGGLVGWNRTKISACYSTGSVDANESVGGLVGRNYPGEVGYCFWDIETSGQASSAGGTGKTTAEMQTMSTFTDAGWDFVGEKFNGIENIWFIPQQDYPHLWWEGMKVPMKLTPRTLNCRSKGNWVKAHLTLPEGFTVADVDSNRPAVLHSFGFESAPLYVFVNENELVEIEAAFEREAVCSLAGDWPEALTVAGFLTDGNIFLGTSTVRMIAPGLKVIEDLASCWLQGDCVHPTWCDGIDLNRDSMVNLLDYALLLNSQVEFIRE